jgi:putative membrane protein
VSGSTPRITPRIETEDGKPAAAAAAFAMPPLAAPTPVSLFIEPRIEAEDLPAARLEGLPELADPTPRGGWGMPALVGTGSAVLVLGLSGLEIGNFVSDEFARSEPLGFGALAIAGMGIGLVASGFLKEASALGALKAVDRLRADLLGTDPHRRVRAARAWLGTLPEGPALLPAINAVNDPDAILTLLRAGPALALRTRAEALGRTAAIQAVAGIAAMPSPGLAALYIAWRGLRLVRQVAALHGMRPGLFGTMALLRRTAMSAGAVAGAEMAANAAAHAVLSSPVLQHVAGEMAGAGVAARRMIVLARAADAACSPL